MKVNKKIKTMKVFLIMLIAFVFFGVKMVYAVDTQTPAAVTPVADAGSKTFKYTLLESFPGFFTGGTEMTDLPAMILAIYKFGIWTIGISGLFMVTIGGIMYAGSAGNTSASGKAKEIITDALIGIVAAMAAYLVLYVINPDLTKINITFTTANVDESQDFEVGSQLTSSGSQIAPSGSCGGMPTSVPKQCALASGELSNLLSCMKNLGAKGTVYSITASNVGGDLAKSQACCGNSSCVHSTNSCHYGCPAGLSGSWQGEKGYSHGFDIGISGTSEAEKCQLATIAKSCGAGTIWGPADMCGGKVRYQSGHGTHFHISTKSCNH